MDFHFRAAGVHFVPQANLPDNKAASGCAKNISNYETVKLIEKYEIESCDLTTRDKVSLALTGILYKNGSSAIFVLRVKWKWIDSC